MEKSRLYTGTGDKGTTSLVGGQRVGKDSVRLEAYGTLDEFSSHLGIVEALEANDDALRTLLRNIQNRLFNIGAYLATEPAPGEKPEPFGLSQDHCREIEEAIDALDAAVPKIKSFVLPGGCMASAQAHVARTVCRRAERRIVALARESWVSPLVLTYFNRLSDFLFILSRWYNFRAGVQEIVWTKD